MFEEKIKVLDALKDAGYNTYRLQKDKLLAGGTVQKLRSGDTSLTVENLNTICELMRCQPGDILEWVSDEKEDTIMPDLMQTLFDYIIDYTHETYCLQTKRTAYSVLQDSARFKLEEQLTEEQLKLFDLISLRPRHGLVWSKPYCRPLRSSLRLF